MVWLEEPRSRGGCLRTAAPFKRSGLRVQVAGGLLVALVSRIDEQAEAAKGGVDEPLLGWSVGPIGASASPVTLTRNAYGPADRRGVFMIAEAMPWKSPLVRARLSLGLVATFLGLLAILHFLEPEFNSGHLISEYQLGRHGWMMSLAFCTLGIGAMLLAEVIPPNVSTRSGRLGPRGLWLIGVALFTAGLFPPTPTRPIVAYVHGVSGLVVILASPIVFLLASRRLAPEPAWSGTSRYLRWATALAWVGLLSFLGSTVVSAGRAAGDPTMDLARLSASATA
jgi:Protein of unknown function (DUF998)